MPRKPKVQRTPEEKWQIVLEGLKSGNVAETCRKYEIAPTLYYRWKDEVEEGAKAALGGRSAAARPDVEQEKRIKQLERALGRSHLQIEILKNVLGECAAAKRIRRHESLWPRARKPNWWRRHWRSAGRVCTIGGNRAAAAPVARTTSRSLPPAARNRLTVSVAWSGGWDGITGWWSTASGSCVSCENAD